jgi:hypothetical protein
MGCTNSKVDIANVFPEMGQASRFNSYLATLPPLFTETHVDKKSFLCTAYVQGDFRSMIFACVDTNANYYEKFVPEEELLKTKDRINVNGSISSWQFLNSMRHAFFNRKVSLEFSEEEDKELICNFNIEFNFTTIGSTSLRIQLNKVTESYERIIKIILYPLFEFYSARLGSEKIHNLEVQIKEYEKKIALLEKDDVDDEEDEEQLLRCCSSSGFDGWICSREETDVPANELQNNNDQEDSNLVGVPADKMLKFLKEIKNKLAVNNAITESEQKSFSQVVDILMNEEQWDIQFSNSIVNEVDMEVIRYLKAKFTMPSTQVRAKKDTEAVSLITASEWNSENIVQSKTRQDILEMFDRVDDWNFDVFTLEKLTGGHVLFITAYTLMVKYDFLNKFHIPEQILINFLKEIEAGYHPNPYHNAMHASDVLQVVHYTIVKGGLAEILSDEETMSVLFSAIIHDYDHPGYNNAFLANTKSYLATLYNDRSILENHHAAQTFALMKSPQFNIFCGMTTEQRKEVRETVIDIVLATDMGRHAKILSKFKGKVENGIDLKKKEDIRLILQIVIKVADINNTSRPTWLYLKWAKRIVDEFYQQGDRERELEMPVTPLMDRTKASMSKGQIAFANFLVIPMFQSFVQLFPKMKFLLNYVEDNKRYWEHHETIEEEYLIPRASDARHELLM